MWPVKGGLSGALSLSKLAAKCEARIYFRVLRRQSGLAAGANGVHSASRRTGTSHSEHWWGKDAESKRSSRFCSSPQRSNCKAEAAQNIQNNRRRLWHRRPFDGVRPARVAGDAKNVAVVVDRKGFGNDHTGGQ